MIHGEDALAELAAAYGVATGYTDQQGRKVAVDPQAVRAVLAALDVDASDVAACRRSLVQATREQWLTVVAATLVLRELAANDPAPAYESQIRVPRGAAIGLKLICEDGSQRSDLGADIDVIAEHVIDGVHIEERRLLIPRSVPLGWHQLQVMVDGELTTSTVVVSPRRLEWPKRLGGRASGLAVQLYSVRSENSWGTGDLGDLADLANWFGRTWGLDYILVNPMHAAAPTVPMEPSPYLPVTRRYANPIYIHIESIPEFAQLPADELMQVVHAGQSVKSANHTSELLDRDRVWQAKDVALRMIHAHGLSPARELQFRDYCVQEGDGLESFALWCALAVKHGALWTEWPTELQDPTSPQVARIAHELADEVDYFKWLQWLIDEQMANATEVAREAGMQIGIMHDLAVGVHRFGADSWTERDVLAAGITVGAPPDHYNQLGQNWNQPPRRPDRLAQTGYAAWREMLQTLLRHSGGLRIDHVLGLFRQWWIPAGNSAKDGTYVRFDHEAMVDILVLEAHRMGALVVGEDLGTVEPWVRDVLADRGILGTSILWFERAGEKPIPPEKWRSDVMASVTVHDLPPSQGYLAGDHVTLRHELGLLTDSLETEQQRHEGEIAGWKQLLTTRGLLRDGASDDEVVVAAHRLLAASGARLIAASLPDLVGERAIQNQPGTDKEYPNWQVPLCDERGEPVLIEDLPEMPRLAQIMNAMGAQVQQRGDQQR